MTGKQTVPRERPEIRNVEDFWCWLNTWGDLRERAFSTDLERRGYERCIRDAMDALAKAGIGWDEVPQEAWDRWSRL